MELDQEKQNQEAAERCRALAQRVVRELAPRSVQVLEDSGLLEKAFCKMNTAVVQSAPELLVVADPQWVTLPPYRRKKCCWCAQSTPAWQTAQSSLPRRASAGSLRGRTAARSS